MKIAWFTPFSVKSAIGKYSKLATDALSKYAVVDIFLFEKENLLQTKLKTIYCAEIGNLINKLTEYDMVVYNMGDNTPYHQCIYEVLQIKKGTIIIHDATLLGFYYGYYCNYKNMFDDFKNLYESLYNDPAENAPSRYLSNDGIDYGFMEHITRFCRGIIVHSDFHENIVKKVYNGPLTRIYFPFSQEYISVKSQDCKVDKDTAKIRMLTVGNINKNKKVLEVVKAIGQSNLLKNVYKYYIVGSLGEYEYINQIETIIERYNIQDNIELIGYVDDETLSTYYRDADVLCNLRNPALEGASWSLVEQMSLGKPIIVSDNGFYSEIPKDCVFKISIENETVELIELLTLIANNHDMLKQKGHNAKNFIDLKFNQEQYAQNFMLFAEHIQFSKPIDLFMDKLSIALNQLGITKGMKIVDTISEQMQLMFNKIEK